jgi:hypothetical protein
LMGASQCRYQCQNEDTNETRGGRHKAESREFHDVLLVRIGPMTFMYLYMQVHHQKKALP